MSCHAQRASRAIMLMMGVGMALGGVMACSGKSKSERLYEEGRLFYKNRKYFNAIDKFEESIKVQDDPRVRAAAAEAYLKSSPSKPEKAIEYAELALEKDDSLNDARLTLGQAHLQLAVQVTRGEGGTTRTLDAEHLGEASRIADELLAKNAQSVEGRLLKARIEAINGDTDGAERLYRGILETHKNNLSAKMGLIELLIVRGNYVEAEVLAREAAHDSSEGTPDSAFRNQLALILLKQGRHEEAYETLAPYLSAENKSPDLGSFVVGSQILFDQLRGLGKDLTSTDPLVASTRTTGTQEAGLAAVQKVGERMAGIGTAMKGFYPSLAESWFIRGVSYEIQENMREAVEHYGRAVSLSPGEKKYRLALGLAYLRRNDTVQARQELSTLLKNNPGDLDARLAMARTSAVEGSTADAIMQLREIRLEYPNDPRAIAMLSRILLLSERAEEVEEGISLLLRMEGEHALTAGQEKLLRARSNMLAGISLSREGRHEEATTKLLESESMLKEVVGGSPENLQASLLLSDLSQRRGDYFDALAHARRASELDPQYRAREAALYSRLGQHGAARRILQGLIDGQPNSIPYALQLVEMEAKDGDVEAAMGRLDASIGTNPGDMRLVLAKAKLLSTSGRTEEAIQLLTQAHADQPEQLGISVQLARLHISRNGAEQAAQLLREAAAQSTQQLTLMRAEGQSEPRQRSMMALSAELSLELALTELMIGQYGEAMVDAQKAAQINAATAVQAAMLEAIGLLGQGQPRQAQDAIQKAEAQQGPRAATLPYLKALALAAAGDAAQGIDVLRNETGMNPDTREMFIGMLQRQSSEALRTAAAPLGLSIQFTSVVDFEAYAEPQIALAEQMPGTMAEEPFVLSRKAEALRRLNRMEEAVAVYEQIQKAMPGFTAAVRQLSIAHEEMARQANERGDRAAGEEHLKQAETYGRLAVEMAPGNGQEVQRLGMILQSLGRTDEANELYRKTIEIDPKNWTSYNNLAWNLAQAGQLDQAAETANRALESAPAGGVGRGGILDTVGWIELQRGNAAGAVGHLRHAALLAPNEPEIRMHYAQALEASGDTGGAAEQIEAIIVATPGYARIGEAREMLRRLAPGSPLLSTAGGMDSATTATTEAPAG